MNDIQTVISDLKKGKFILLTDSSDRENEGDLVCPAEKITPAKIAFMARFGRGLICAPLTEKRAAELHLPPMTEKNTTPFQCNFTISVDAKEGTTTGISAFDRAKTIQKLVDPKTRPEDFMRPGHVFPLVAREGGVLIRSGHTEGSLDLMELAGLEPAAVICEVMGDDGRMLRGQSLKHFAKHHHISIVSIESLIEYRRERETMIERLVETNLQTEYGIFRAVVFKSTIDAKEHVALVMGEISESSATLVRVHSECLTGDVFQSVRCDCKRQLDAALRMIAKVGKGVLLYMRQEGRGIGLVNKLRAYNLQDLGFDTIEANEKLGLPADLREYGIGAQILVDLGVRDMRLMTNNPRKIVGLEGYGLSVVERIPLEIAPQSKRDLKYLRAKKMKLGHWLSNV